MAAILDLGLRRDDDQGIEAIETNAGHRARARGREAAALALAAGYLAERRHRLRIRHEPDNTRGADLGDG